MKQKMKILTTFTLITLLLFNSSCEKDLYEDAIQQNKDFKFKTVNFHEVKKINAKTAQFIENKINKNLNIQARTSELYGKTVDTTNINYLVKDDGYSSFTFKVENDSIGINYIENIIVENYPNQEQEVLLVKYNLNTSVEQFYSNDDSLQNSLTSTETSLYQNTTQSFSRYSCITVGYWDTVDACEGEVDISEHPECLNADGTRATKEVFITIAEDCGFDSGGGGDGGNYGGDPNNGNYDNGSNGGGNYNGAGIFIPNIYNGDEDPNNAEFILAGQVSQYFNSLPQNIKALTNNNTWVYSYLVDYFRNNGNIVNTRNSQYATNALNNYYNFQLNSYSSNISSIGNERLNFWAYYTFLNNNLLNVNTQNVFDIRDFVLTTDYETADNIINYLFLNKDNQDAIEFVKELIDLEINGNLLSFFPSFKYPAGSNYSTLYPNFTILVKEYIPLLKNDQRLLNTINRLTGVSISTIKQDLTWGNGPEINITQLGLDLSGNPYYGKFNILEPNKIYIDIDLIQQIEALSNIPNPTPQQNQQIGFLNALITFSVCLHEYVHYSDFAFDGTMQDNENLELGLLFEEIYLGGYYEFNPNGNVIFIKAN
ncbi:MAG: hypothetical protein L6Q46_05925 [Flavobacterium sp.]|uniref:hypothetical protein n=1 Tax=Flavobacterium sp. TaxID=239 RepID=UPI0025C5DDD5|nr:hypothetical protein [Flavobacterium sp.]MCK6607828.1 hypothetical protein [Flavobacterium sp.]